MSVVPPVAALAPTVPLLVGLAAGEVPGPVQTAGLALATLGVAISSVRRGQKAVTPQRLRSSIGYGLLAALGFGTFFLAMGRASRVDIPWSLLTSRSTAVATLAIVAAVGALHPLVTIGLARIRLHEVLSYPQRIGIATTLTGVAAISVA